MSFAIFSMKVLNHSTNMRNNMTVQVISHGFLNLQGIQDVDIFKRILKRKHLSRDV